MTLLIMQNLQHNTERENIFTEMKQDLMHGTRVVDFKNCMQTIIDAIVLALNWVRSIYPHF